MAEVYANLHGKGYRNDALKAPASDVRQPCPGLYNHPHGILADEHQATERTLSQQMSGANKEHSRQTGILHQLAWAGSLLVIALISVAGLNALNRFFGAPMTEPLEQHSLRVMTWNIGKLYLRWDSRASDNDLNHVATILREVNPHVAALQEIKNRRQLGQLVAVLGPGWRGMLTEDRYDRRAALVVRLPAKFHRLPTSSGRVAQAVVITLPNGTRAAVASIHLDAFDAKRRLLQAEEILAGARRLKQANLILAGDFNIDSAVAARGSKDQDLYLFLSQRLRDAGKGAGATTLVSRRLDYVFFKGPNLHQTDAQVLKDRRVNVMDHDPLVVEFSY